MGVTQVLHGEVGACMCGAAQDVRVLPHPLPERRQRHPARDEVLLIPPSLQHRNTIRNILGMGYANFFWHKLELQYCVKQSPSYVFCRRGYTHERYRRIVDNIRRHMPNASVSGDAIVGFPGETVSPPLTIFGINTRCLSSGCNCSQPLELFVPVQCLGRHLMARVPVQGAYSSDHADYEVMLTNAA